MTRIVFAPSRQNGKTAFLLWQMNEALKNGAAVALACGHGVFSVPPRYTIESPHIAGRWSLRTPEGMLVRYRVKPKERPDV